MYSAVGSLPWCTIGHTALETYQRSELYCNDVKPVIDTTGRKLRMGRVWYTFAHDATELMSWTHQLYKFWRHSCVDHKRSVIMKALADDWNDGQKCFLHFVQFLSYCTALVLRHRNSPPYKAGCRPGKNLHIELAPAHDQDILFCSMCVSNPQQSHESHHQCFL